MPRGRTAAVALAVAVLVTACGNAPTLRDRREEDPTAVTPAADELAGALLPAWPVLQPRVPPERPARDPAGGQGAAAPRPGPPLPPVRLLVLSDIHHLSPTLWEPGDAFARWLSTNDGKVLARSGELLAMIEERILREHARTPLDAAVITGDLTANGERVGHAEVAAMGARLRAQGVPLLVIPGNHDMANPWAAEFSGNQAQRVPTVDRTAMLDIYRESGFGDAVSVAPDDLSYRYDLGEQLSLIMLDTAMYDRNAELGFPQPTGEIGPRQRQWLETELAAARDEGRALLVFMHHNLLSHGRLSGYGTLQYVVDDAARLARSLAEAGVPVVFTGHIHARNSTGTLLESAGWIYDLAPSAVSLFPHEYRLISIDEQQQLRLEPRHLVAPLPETDPARLAYLQDFARWSLATYLSDIKVDRRETLEQELLATAPGDSIAAVLCESDAEGCTAEEQLTSMALYLGVWSLLHRDGQNAPGLPSVLTARAPRLGEARELWRRHAPERYARLVRGWGSDPAPPDGPLTIDLRSGLWR